MAGIVLVLLTAASVAAAARSWAAEKSYPDVNKPEVAPGVAALAQRSGAATGPDMLTGLIAVPIASPHPVWGADGNRHLVYELQLTNVLEVELTVRGIDTVVPGSGRVVTRLDEKEVAARLTPFAAARTGATLGPGGAGTVLMDTTVSPGARMPARLAHDFTLSFDPDPGLPTT